MDEVLEGSQEISGYWESMWILQREWWPLGDRWFLQRYVVLREIGGYERDKDKEDIVGHCEGG